MLKTSKLLDLFEIDTPIIQAPMAGTSSAALVAAVSNAGALGSFGAASLSVDALRETIKDIRSKTNRPFNINLFAEATEKSSAGTTSSGIAKLLETYHHEKQLGDLPQAKALFGPCNEQLAVLIEEKVPVISFHFGIEAEQVERIHTAGLKVICSATTVAEAQHLETLGVDAVIAQGAEAGGHRGNYLENRPQALIGSLALLPQVVDAVNIPVIAAGGIMDGRGIVACAALGAQGVQLGTAFLGCDEAPTAAAWREQLSLASAADTVVTSAISGKPARGLKTRFVKEVEALKEELQPYPWHYSMSAKLRQAAAKTNDADFLVMWSGQGVGMYREMPAAQLIETLIQETMQVKKTL